MIERLIVLLILYTLIIVSDWKKWKQGNLQTRLAYGTVMLASVYLSIIFITGWKWPNLNNLIDFFLAYPAKLIVGYLKQPS